MEFGIDFHWRPVFAQESFTMPMWSILDEAQIFEQCSRIYRCCTFRDGSRYYKEFANSVNFIRNFLLNKKSLDDYQHLDINFYEFITALIDWKSRKS